MSRRWKWIVGIVVVLALVVAAGLVYERPMLETGTGYAAHNACAVRLVADRGAGTPADDLPPNPLVPVLRTSVDTTQGRAHTSVLGVLFGQTAYYTKGLGCTLADGPPDLTPIDLPAAAPADQPWPEGARVDPPPDSVDTAGLNAAIDAAFAEDDPQGRAKNTRAVVIVHGGRIVAERYADGFDADTRQLGWSMTKSITNAMVGRLVQQGRIAVDDDHLLSMWSGDDPRGAITLDDLLRMTSGLSWDETYALGTEITNMLYRTDDMGRFAASQPLAHDPGTYQQYSSGTTNIVCDILQDASGMGVDMAQQLVFDPIGMRSAIIEPDASGGLVCSSYGWATPRDWARFGLWFLNGGAWDGTQLLPDGWIDYSTHPINVTSEEEPYGAFWWLNRGADGSLRFPSLPADTYWASGHDGQQVAIVPSADLVVVRMGFTPEIPGDEIGIQDLVAAAVDAVS